MTLKSLDNLLITLVQQPHWATYQRYHAVCQVWNVVVDPQIATHTRPLYIKRNILWIATSSAVWSQQLSFQRYALLKQINIHLSPEPLGDLHFSSGQWYQSNPWNGDKAVEESRKQTGEGKRSKETRIHPPEETFQKWVQSLQQRNQALPSCPQCHCPTPPEELKRWSKCSLCMVQLWQQKS